MFSCVVMRSVTIKDHSKVSKKNTSVYPLLCEDMNLCCLSNCVVMRGVTIKDHSKVG